MNKLFLFASMLFMGLQVVAQDNVSDSSEVVEVLAGDLSNAQQDFDQANTDYSQALVDYNAAKAALIEADNNLTTARTQVRTTRRALAAADKVENPIVIERYSVEIFPILEKMSKGEQYGYSVFLEGSEGKKVFNVLSKNAETEFKRFMSQYTSDKVRRSKGELFFDNIFIPTVSNTSMDIFTKFEKESEGVKMKVYVNKGDGFINGTTQSQEDDAIRELIDQFARNIRLLELQQQLEDEQKELGKMRKDIEKYQREVTRAKEDINKTDQAIADYINTIEAIEQQTETQQELIERTQMKLDRVN